jgi:transcriptional regulator with XRE-family HTH domain
MPSRPWVVSPAYRAGIEAIRALRMERGLSLRDVAGTLNKPHSWLHKVERLERRLDVIEFVALAKALGCTPEDLFARVLRVLPDDFEL